MSSKAAELKVKKLARLPGNTRCANCGTCRKFGFSTVCIKYYTFVCNNCKSSHQAISHRCKSLTMSSWTDEEAMELQRKGNDYARRTWLKNAPPVGQGGRPKEGDVVDVFKRFVVDAYERKRFYGEDEGASPAAAVATTAPVPRVASVAPATTRTAAVRRAAPPRAQPQADPPVADLLDFTPVPSSTPAVGATSASGNFEANFDAFAPAAPVPASGPSLASNNGSSFNFMNRNNNNLIATQSPVPETNKANTGSTFQANFDAFAQSGPVAGSGTSAAPTNFATPIFNDPFSPVTPAQPQAASNGSSFNFMNNNSNIMSSPATAPLAPVPPPMKKPVMNNHSMNQKSSLISSMSMPASGSVQQGHGMGKGMGMNTGWNNNNNNQGSFGGMGNMGNMQQQMMMQQQQMNIMNGMAMNSNNIGFGMMNNMNNNNMMMMGNNNMNPRMMNQQQTMMNGNNYGGGMMVNANGKSKSGMNSLQMNSSSMNAYSSGWNN